MTRTLIRYWGGCFKSSRQASNCALEIEPLVERGWNCHLVLQHEPEDPAWLAGLRQLGVGISCLPRVRRSFDLGNILAVHRLCKETGCVVFHCENMHMSPLIGAALASVPVRIWQKHAMNSHYEQCREPGWRERLALQTRLSVALSTRVIAVSNAIGDELTELGLARSKIVVMNNPRPEMQDSGASRADTRRALKIPEDSVVLVTIGRAEMVKGWDLLIKAFAAVAAADPRAHLLLVGALDVRGDTAFMQVLRDLVAREGLEHRVCFAGHVTDIKAMLLAADLFVLPSRSEGFCWALLEALEASLPCVATRVGIATEVISDGGPGVLVPRNDPEELGRAILALMRDDRRRASMASLARIPDDIPGRHQYARMLADLYESLITA